MINFCRNGFANPLQNNIRIYNTENKRITNPDNNILRIANPQGRGFSIFKNL